MLEKIDRALLTEDQQKAINVWESFFSHPGYAQYIERIKERQEAYGPAWKTATNSRELGVCQGQEGILTQILNFEQLIALEFNQLIAEHDEEQEFDSSEDEEDASLIA